MRQCYIGCKIVLEQLLRKKNLKLLFGVVPDWGEELALDNVFLYYAGVEISLPVWKCRGFYVNLQAEIYFIKT